jgi:diguanylate cyclase (GGDEF)-like protein
VDGRAIAAVAAYVDQTEQRDTFYGAFLIVATLLCGLNGVAFALPAIGWFHGAKEKQRAERRIRFLAHHDALTALANRAHLIDQLDSALARLAPSNVGLAVHFIDIDRFKNINDTYGHDGGDFLLKAVAARLRSAARNSDVISRLGGDEFVVVQIDVLTHEEVEAFAQRIMASMVRPLTYKEHEIVTTVSVGVAMAPRDGTTSERLLKSADLALYQAKLDGRNRVCFFKPELDSQLKARLELERTIREAVANNGFELHYQPLFGVAGRDLIGFEALVRLRKDDGTLMLPVAFIPVAEEMRLIDKIGEWVLREACVTAAEWPSHLTVAVNLSPAQFATGSVSSTVAETLKATGLEPRRLELEITETLMLGETEAVIAELQALRALGVSIVMDDFGTGYSSLSYLWRFPFDKIKIDRSFMQAFDGSGRDAETVVKTIIALGRELHMRVTVEGVETAKQVDFLEDANGDEVQGFYFGKPMPASELGASILADFQRKTVPRRELPKIGEKLRGAK